MLVLPISYRYFKGMQVMRVLAGIAMMLFSLIYIQQHLGRIEMHFHIFIGLAIISLYKDIVPVFVAAATTTLHHLIFNYLQLHEVSFFGMPVMVFKYGCGMDIVLLHVIFVVIEALIIGYIIKLHIEYAVDLNRSENEIKDLNFTSLHDPLTGLTNRTGLYAKLQMMLAGTNRNREKVAVLFLDLDHCFNFMMLSFMKPSATPLSERRYGLICLP
jgi:predicted signal transduction protein with EAL and GGDEF domain